MRFRIDLKIFIFLVLFYFTKQIKIYAFIMLFGFIHELGHLMAGFIVGMKPEKIELMPFGFSIAFKINAKEYNKKLKKGNMLELKKILVAIAGPFTNFLVICISSHLEIDIIESIIIIYTNILIMLFNLIPVYPLDGGRILKGILHIEIGREKSEKYTNSISKIFVIILISISSILILYIKNISIFVIDIYLLYLVVKEDIKYQKRKDIYKKILENEMI